MSLFFFLIDFKYEIFSPFCFFFFAKMISHEFFFFWSKKEEHNENNLKTKK